MYTCTDACTHSKQGVGPEEDDCNIHTLPSRGNHVPCNCIGDGADMESHMDITTCTDAGTHSKQGVGTEVD